MSQELITILSLLFGGSGGGLVIFKAIMDTRSNAAKNEKEFNKRVIESLQDTQHKLEVSQKETREYAEYSSELIGFMLRQGIYKKDIPKGPDDKES